MKVARFRHGGADHLGMVDIADETITRIESTGPPNPDHMIAFIDQALAGSVPVTYGEPLPLADVRLLAPIMRPSKNVICVGKNYREHAQEFSRSGFDTSAGREQQAIPHAPIVFSKAPCGMWLRRLLKVMTALLGASYCHCVEFAGFQVCSVRLRWSGWLFH